MYIKKLILAVFLLLLCAACSQNTAPAPQEEPVTPPATSAAYVMPEDAVSVTDWGAV